VYANCILDYVLYRSYQKDSEFAGNAQRAMMHYQSFANALGVKTQADGATTPVPASSGMAGVA
jgi:branched-subunit amino acid ABC-type transport system permease component